MDTTGASVRPIGEWLSGSAKVACAVLRVAGGASMVLSVGTRVNISSIALSLSITTLEL